MKNTKSYLLKWSKEKIILLLILNIVSTNIFSQTAPFVPWQCTFTGSSNQATSTANCQHTTPYYLPAKFAINSNTPLKYVKVNCYFISKNDGSGNFDPSNSFQMQTLNDVFAQVNAAMAGVYSNNSGCPLTPVDTKIRYVFIPHFNDNSNLRDDFYWNNQNDFNSQTGGGGIWTGCPDRTNWFLLPLASALHTDPAYQKGIDCFFNEDLCWYENWVLHITPSCTAYYNDAHCSMWPDYNDMNAPSYVHFNGFYGKWYNFMINGGGTPGTWLYNTFVYDMARSILHELGHTFDLTHLCNCDVIMEGNTCTQGEHTYFNTTEINQMHRALSLTNMRSFVQNCSFSATDAVTLSGINLWDHNAKYYSDVIIPSGAQLTVTCKILMAAGAKIKIKKGGKLIIDGGTLTSGCKEMWKGIEVDLGATLEIKNSSLVENAEYAVSAVAYSNFSLINSTFDKNYVSVYIPETTTGSYNINGIIYGCTFDCTAPLLPAYTGQQNSIGAKPYAGIFANDCILSIGNASQAVNNFQNLNCGIVGKRSSLTLNNNQFINIKRDYSYTKQGDGSSVYVDGSGGDYFFNQNGRGASFTDIQNCENGIYTYAIGCDIKNTKMTGVAKGITVSMAAYKKVTITSNYIDSYAKGIELTDNDGASLLVVRYNQLNVNPDINLPHNGAGIYVFEAGLTSNRIAIRDNLINVYYGTYGINVVATNKILIYKNTILLQNNNFALRCISMYGSKNASVSCNTLQNTSTTTSSHVNNYAFYLLQGTANVLCNNFSRSYQAVHIEGTCTGSTIAGNSFNNHNKGLFYSATATTGEQRNKANVWNGTYASGVGAVHQGSSLIQQLSTYYLDPYVLPYKPGSSFTNSNWFKQDNFGTPLYNCTNNYVCNTPIEVDDTQYDKLVGGGNYNPDVYPLESKWQAEKLLYERLREDTIVLDTSALFSGFFDAHENSNFERFAEISDKSEFALAMEESLRNSLDLNRTQIDNLHSQIDDNIAVIASNSLSASAIMTLEANNQQMAVQIETLSNFNNSSIRTLESNRITEAINAGALASSIVTNQIYEMNQKTISEIYLSTIARGNTNFTPAQVQSILDIANQCIYAGGQAVAVARGYYNLIDESAQWNDDLVCLQSGIVLRKADDSNDMENISDVEPKCLVLPNPANSVIKVFYSSNKEAINLFYIYDETGRQVKFVNFDGSASMTTINISDLANGIYQYALVENNIKVWSGKLVIVK